MDMLKQTPPRPVPVNGWAPLALGFRPFFLLAGVAAVLLMLLWGGIWHQRVSAPAYYGAVAWHGHEMLFGYAAAVIAGFLLTAVRNWTGAPTWTGGRLGLLAVLWLLGRLLPWLGGVPTWVVPLVDVAFLPLVAWSLYAPLWQGQNKVNRVFVPLLLSMALANLFSHLQLLGVVEGIGDMRRVMVELVLLLIALVGGRVMPFFTQNVVPGFKPKRYAWVETLTFVGLGLIAAGEASALVPAAALGALWLSVASLQAIRLGGWFDRRVFKIPVLWVLHLGYAWLALGAALVGLSGFGAFPGSSALHALTAGAIGVFTLGMMARVTRGHTGRPIDVDRPVVAAFVAANVAALMRVFGTAWFASGYAMWVDLSSTLWVIAFALFAYAHVPMLLRMRIDGRPG